MVHSTSTDTPRLVQIDSHIKYNASKLNANRNDAHLDFYLNSFIYVHYLSNNCIHDIIDVYKSIISHAVLALRYFIKEALILPMIPDLSTSVQLSDRIRLVTETKGDMKVALMYHIAKRHYITVLYIIHSSAYTDKSMLNEMYLHIICRC